jgi:CRP/FNR family transcriptional regulator, cyclic AMP receptor protein
MALRVLNRRTFQAGEQIFCEGDRGDRAYIVESGAVAIEKKRADGSLRLLGKIPAGGIFGEMALVDNQPRMATARAVVDSVCLMVPKALLEKKLDAADPFVAAMLRILISNARQAAND